MISRRARATVQQALARQPAVALLGPRQVGKTTLALEVASSVASLYLDLESAADRAKLESAELYLSSHEEVLVVLDEIHRVPDLFSTLRVLIDRGRRRGHKTGRFLLLGSASLELLRQSSESLAGRIAHVELAPLDVSELSGHPAEPDRLWQRGGFPESFLADDDRRSFEWRRDFIRSYLERDIPQFGPRVPAETLRRFWTMLAHSQGAPLNAARLASGLGVSGQTVARYADLLVDLLLVRRLEPLHANVSKRLVKSPRLYIRDSGIVHALLGLQDLESLLGSPVVGASWEGFVIENILRCAPDGTTAGFFRTHAGAEIDLVLDLPQGERWAIEVKRSLTPRLERGFHEARADIEPERCFVVYAGSERYPVTEGVEAIGLAEMMQAVGALRS